MTIQGKTRSESEQAPNKPLLSVLCHQQLKGYRPAPERLIKKFEYSY